MGCDVMDAIKTGTAHTIKSTKYRRMENDWWSTKCMKICWFVNIVFIQLSHCFGVFPLFNGKWIKFMGGRNKAKWAYFATLCFRQEKHARCNFSTNDYIMSNSGRL